MKRSMFRTIDKIAREVRKRRVLDIVTFCDVLDLSPSSFYNYRKFVTSKYHDIVYENGEFRAIEVTDIES